MNQKNKIERVVPSPLVSFVPLAVLVLFLSVTIYEFGDNALAGGSQVCLLVSSAVCVALSMWRYRVKWKSFESAIAHNVKRVTEAFYILLIIGALSGAWMMCGVVPTLIYYGLQLIHPTFFLVSCCVICALVSVMTGSSWTTIATLGVALIGIGQAQGFHEGWVAGAIISGAYFGDKLSPLSDTTVLASSTIGVKLFEHIRYMLLTTLPALIIALLVYLLVGLSMGSGHHVGIEEYKLALSDKFNLSLWSLIVPALTAYMIYRRLPSLVTLFLSTLLACLYAMVAQPDVLLELSGASAPAIMSSFRGVMQMVFGETNLQMGSESLNDLVSTRGMSGMMDTIWLILCAMCFGGVMEASGFLLGIAKVFMKFVRNTFSLVSSTVACGLFMNLVTADQYISIILTGNMFKTTYEHEGYDARLLSRSTEDAVTVTSPLVPWNTCGMTQAAILGVSTWTYLPYCVFNYVCPMMSVALATIGYRILRKKPATESIEE